MFFTTIPSPLYIYNSYFNFTQKTKRSIFFKTGFEYQKNQKIKGVIKLKEFLKKLSNNQILFDTAYIIEK